MPAAEMGFGPRETTDPPATMCGTMSGPRVSTRTKTKTKKAPGGGRRRQLLGIVDYTLAKRALLREFRGGLLSRFEICDAHPELLRAARYMGEPSSRTCPVCDRDELKLLA